MNFCRLHMMRQQDWTETQKTEVSLELGSIKLLRREKSKGKKAKKIANDDRK